MDKFEHCTILFDEEINDSYLILSYIFSFKVINRDRGKIIFEGYTKNMNLISPTLARR